MNRQGKAYLDILTLPITLTLGFQSQILNTVIWGLFYIHKLNEAAVGTPGAMLEK